MNDSLPKLNGDSWRKEAMRVVLAMTTAAGTVYTSVRTALSNHESRIGVLESRQDAQEQREVPRQELEAHWNAIAEQLSRIEQDLRDIRYEQRHPH
jgi:uncharacterized membrane-anchored protein YhcB (DUF1043 family)